jgi:hypothetical protein
MKKSLIILFLLLTKIFCFGQIYSDIISDKEIISFLTWEVNSTEGYSEEPLLSFKRKISAKIAKWNSLNFIKPDSLSEYDFSVTFLYLYQKKNVLDTIFKNEDKQYLFEQFESCKDSTWQNKIPKATITSRKNKKRPNQYYYSIPLFSKDKKYVIIKREYYCGSLCAHGGYFIYKRLNENSWELVKIVNGWIS